MSKDTMIRVPGRLLDENPGFAQATRVFQKDLEAAVSRMRPEVVPADPSSKSAPKRGFAE